MNNNKDLHSRLLLDGSIASAWRHQGYAFFFALTVFGCFLLYSRLDLSGAEAMRPIVGLASSALMIVLVWAVPPETRLNLSKPLLWLMFSWLLFSTLSVLMAEATFRAIARQMDWIAAISIAGLLGRRPNLVSRYAPVVGTWLCIVFIATMIDVLLLNLWRNNGVWDGRIYPFSNIRHIAYWALVAYMLALWRCCLPTSQRLHHLVSILTGAIALWYLMWSGSRGALLGLILGILLAGFWLLAWRRIWTYICWTLLAALVLWMWAHDETMQLFVLFRDSTAASNLVDVGSGRWPIWVDCYFWLLKSPWLGYGPDSYALMPGKPFGIQPHNLLLQTALDWGVIAALSMILILILLIGSAVSKARPQLPELRSLSLLVVMPTLFLSLIDGPLYHAWGTVWLGALLGVLLAARGVGLSTSAIVDSRGGRVNAVGLLMALGLFQAIALIQVVSMEALPAGGRPSSVLKRLTWWMPVRSTAVPDWIEAWESSSPLLAAEWRDWAMLNIPQRSRVAEQTALQFDLQRDCEAARHWYERAKYLADKRMLRVMQHRHKTTVYTCGLSMEPMPLGVR